MAVSPSLSMSLTECMLKRGAEWEDCVDLYEAEAARQILSDYRSELKKKRRAGSLRGSRSAH